MTQKKTESFITLRAPTGVFESRAAVQSEDMHTEGYRERRRDHVSECFILEIVTSGRGTHIWDGEKSDLSRGDVYLMTPVTHHRIDSNNLEITSVYFDDTLLDSSFTRLISFSSPLSTRYTIPELEELLHNIEEISAEQSGRNSFSLEMSRAILSKVLITFLRKCSLGPSESVLSEGRTAGLMLSYILHNLRREITLRDIAEAVGITPNYLGEIFIEATGMTCSAFVREERLKLAIKLLKGTSFTVEHISAICGFKSVSYFVKTFRESFSVTPFTFRRTGYTEQQDKSN